jgi:putative hydrolase of the HAD superfamily
LWRRELARLGLSDAVDAVVLCGDVGWRKPARQIFEAAAKKLDCRPAECVFVGGDVRWDVGGCKAAGMRAVLIDREGRCPEYNGERIAGLHGVLAVLGSGA